LVGEEGKERRLAVHEIGVLGVDVRELAVDQVAHLS